MDKLQAIRGLVKDEGTWTRVLDRVTYAVQRSFREDRRRSTIVLLHSVPNETEIKRRTLICYDWFCTMRTDCGYSTERALDTLPVALRATLDDRHWEPPMPVRGWTAQETQ